MRLLVPNHDDHDLREATEKTTAYTEDSSGVGSPDTPRSDKAE
jgi:hypothetical protein